MRLRIGKLSTLFTLALAATAFGCSSESDEQEGSKQLEIYSWLTSGSEKTSLDNLLNVVKERNPGLVITNAAQDRSEIAQKELPQRIADGNPPDSFQAIPGLPLQEWINRGALESLNGIATQQNWASVFPKEVLDSVSKDGQIYAVPLNIERGNTLFYNKALIPDAEAPKTMDAFFAKAAELKAKGIDALSVSARGGWTIGGLLFDGVFLATAGPEYANEWLAGRKTADTPEIRASLDVVAKMMDYANADRTALGWDEAVGKVCEGKAAMILLADFVKGEFASRGCKSDKVGYVPVQMEGSPTFAFIGMSWPLTLGAPHRDMGVEFLSTTASVAGQAAFNPTKGSIPARTDMAEYLERDFDIISQQTAADFRSPDSKLVLAWAAATSSIFQEKVNEALKDFVDPAHTNYKNVESVMTVIKQYYGVH